MDFILSLTHFCEVHGPTSILCSQVLPFSCSQCHPDESDISPSETPSTSHDTASTSSRRGTRRFSSSPANLTLSTSLTGSIKSNATHSPQNLEDLPYFLKPQQPQTQTDPAERLNRLGETNGETCASCSISLPEDVSKKLPASPSSTKGDGKAKNNNSPVLRSREVVYSCGGAHSESEEEAHDPHLHASLPDSLHSLSVSSDVSCHTHILTYLSLHDPPKPADYALLRQSSIRTLSCELLPRGLSSGRLCFGDSVAGYTIAYVFRLPDPMARGKRRSYALVALAGKDATRAFRASPIIWRIFQRIATGIVTAAEKHQEEEKKREEQALHSSNSIGGRDFTPISSFLTGRAYDPNGNPRRAGQIRARNLAEIVGNDYIFAELHAQFVTLLQQLGNMFGGVPISDERFICSTVAPEETVPSESRRSSVATASTTSKADSKQPPRHRREPSDLGLSSLNMSSRPQPIPISSRRPIAT
ncbi:vesicle coat protein [Talaromyces proteolyticus]|uniref:Vesicle coat protein n=1 Tax=Talaromyces proteolyticus TaxID=1131652 RepID=A0AAD4KI54_9EURO|nr:vesicle coat protein [Talaromyces proteolyticus]KAH8692992.1 vesicle coat protein [Talaromyces proteolyticus]